MEVRKNSIMRSLHDCGQKRCFEVLKSGSFCKRGWRNRVRTRLGLLSMLIVTCRCYFAFPLATKERAGLIVRKERLSLVSVDGERESSRRIEQMDSRT